MYFSSEFPSNSSCLLVLLVGIVFISLPGVNMRLLSGCCRDMIKMDYTYIFFSPSICISIAQITSSDDVAICAARFVCIMHFMVDSCVTS